MAVVSRPDTVDQDLTAIADRLTCGLRQQYTQLPRDVIAPGVKRRHIYAAATLRAAASGSANGKHVAVPGYVDQRNHRSRRAHSQTPQWAVRFDKFRVRWFISPFDPV